MFHRAINFRDTSQSQSSGSDEGEEENAATLAESFVTVRLTRRRMTRQPEAEAERLQAILSERR